MADSKDKASAPQKEAAPETVQSGTVGAEAAADQTEEWVFTLNSATGEVVKVERIDRASGHRSEISNEEYAALCGYMDPSAAAYAAYGFDVSGGEPTGGDQVYEAGYYQGLADYEASLAEYEMAAAAYGYGGASSGYSPEEEAAYLQGMADYEALLG